MWWTRSSACRWSTRPSTTLAASRPCSGCSPTPGGGARLRPDPRLRPGHQAPGPSPAHKGLVENMISFNIGVEVGQLIALSVILAVMVLWRRTASFGRLSIAANVLIMTAGFALIGVSARRPGPQRERLTWPRPTKPAEGHVANPPSRGPRSCSTRAARSWSARLIVCRGHPAGGIQLRPAGHRQGHRASAACGPARRSRSRPRPGTSPGALPIPRPFRSDEVIIKLDTPDNPEGLSELEYKVADEGGRDLRLFVAGRRDRHPRGVLFGLPRAHPAQGRARR